MHKSKIIILKIVLLLAIIIGLNYLYQFTLYENDLQTYSPIINQIRMIVDDKNEIVYLGESSNITYKETDLDKRPISDFISDYYPSKKMGSLTKEASHAGIFYELLRNIPEYSSVKTVIVTMNLRSFDANWIYSDLETPLQKSIVLLKNHPPLYKRFLLSFKGYDIKSTEERKNQFLKDWKESKLRFPKPFKYSNVIDWDRGMAESGIKNDDSTINKKLTDLACHYIKAYAFQIDTITNPRIADFDKIVLLAKERNWNLIFNLMAENTKKADSLVGYELTYLMRQNRDLLVQRYQRNGIQVVDNLELVSDSNFIDQNWTTEHYNEYGRKIIAKNVANCLKKYYPKNYKNISE